MAKRNIKGITIEINGDTTNLDKALRGIDNSAKSTAEKLKDVEKTLKLDPKNVDLLAQKQQYLAEAVDQTSQRYEILKNTVATATVDDDLAKKWAVSHAELQKTLDQTEKKIKSLESSISKMESADSAPDPAELEKYRKKLEEAQKKAEGLKQEMADTFEEMGRPISTENLQTLQRELVETKQNFEEAQKAAEDFDPDAAAAGLSELSESADTAGASYGNLGEIAKGTAIGNLISNGIGALINAIGKLIEWIANLDERTEEYRTAIGKLNTAFKSAGFSTEAAEESYTELYKILGNTDNATEAAQLMASLATSEKDLKQWTDIAAGAYGTFGDALPINSLMEAANETAKTGKVVGVLADALNWAGKSEDAFNDSLSKIPSEADRAKYIMNQLGVVYADAADVFYDTNETLIETRENQALMDDALADAGEAVADAKNAFMNELAPSLVDVSEALADFIDSVDWAEFGKQIADFIDGIDFDAVFGTLKDLIDMIGSIASIVGWVWEQVSPIFDAVGGAISAIIAGLSFLLELLDDFLNGSKDFGSGSRGGGFGGGRGGGFSLGGREVQGFASGGVFEPNSPMLGVLGDNTREREVAAPESMLRGLFRDELANFGGKQTVNVNIRFTGSLAQLGRLLNPVVTAETQRQGRSFVPQT